MTNAQFNNDSLESLYTGNIAILADRKPVNPVCKQETANPLSSQTSSYLEILLSYKPFTANWLIALEISADEMTPLAFSASKLFRAPAYGLFVEIKQDSILYTIRKHSKRSNGQSGYFEIIEQERDNFELFYFNSWSIYAKG